MPALQKKSHVFKKKKIFFWQGGGGKDNLKNNDVRHFT